MTYKKVFDLFDIVNTSNSAIKEYLEHDIKETDIKLINKYSIFYDMLKEDGIKEDTINIIFNDLIK